MGSNSRHYPYLCSELVSIATGDQPHAPAVHGNLEAIGESRALLLTEVPLAAGTHVAIRSSTQVLRGTIASCEFDAPLGYFVELRLGDESQWSRAMFEPEHLTAACCGDPKPEPRVFPLVVTEKFVPARRHSRGNKCTITAGGGWRTFARRGELAVSSTRCHRRGVSLRHA